MSKFIISCGGTGGHLTPGLAVGRALIKSGHEAVFLISRKRVDSRLAEKYGELRFIRTPGAAFSPNPAKFLRFAAEFFRAVKFGLRTLKKENCDVVVSFGGFSSLGISIAAALLKIPLVLHEANRKPGKATRFLGRFAARIYVPYGVGIPRRKSGQVKYSGYPVRDEIRRLDPAESKKFFGFPPDSRVLLILGGSQGAEALNNWADRNFERLAKEGMDVLCVCGSGKSDYARRSAKGRDGREHTVKFLEFCDNMAAAMSCADIAIARAGAGTIAELARCGVPSIMVPYPRAADNHQLKNARCFEKQGACVVVAQDDMDKLFAEAAELASNEALRGNMRKNLARVDELNDVSKMVADLSKIARKEGE